jgi:hypothetical protein
MMREALSIKRLVVPAEAVRGASLKLERKD